jgi:diguanylate cyclase (GGDEF)-like protein
MMSFSDRARDFLDRQRGHSASSQMAARASRLASTHPTGIRLRQAKTNLADWATFQQILSEGLAAGEPCAMLLFDIDGLAAINDQFGYATGDAVLRQFGDRLDNAVPLASSIAHLFSDEFAILIVGEHAPGDAEAIALHFMRTMDEPFVMGDDIMRISASVGIAYAPLHGNDAVAMLLAASRALRAAKAVGGHVWRTFNHSMLDEAEEIRRDLSFAIASRQIVPYYQPIIELQSGHVAGFEVLARWNHPKRGLLWPDQFIKLAERDGKLSGITTALLNQVAHDSVAWPEELIFAFNIAPTQIRELSKYIFSHPDPAQVTLPIHRIEIELSETALIDDLDATGQVVDLLQERGARVALDDFGGGHANFRHLRGIPFNRLKIGREFVRDMLDDPRAGICVHSIAEVGHQLGIDVTAQGVSTAAIAARVRDLGCRYAQGTFYSMPVPGDAVPVLLEQLAATAARNPLNLQPSQPVPRHSAV